MKIKIFLLAIGSVWFLSCNNKTETVENTSVIVEETSQSPITSTEEIPQTSEITVETTAPVTSAAPEFMNLGLQGYQVPDINLNELHGQVVFVNHWGSWCGPCRIEMPSIQSLYDKYGEKVKFVMIATERRQGAHIPYLEKEGYTFPVYTMTTPASTEIKPKGFPTTIILDKQGKIRTNDVGAANWDAPSVHEFLDKLLAEN
ncbi:MAG: TlpA disulfide reductase family protein [Flavobacteriaceae bacterium]|nr:TlpA disulfide reductase family protein [Flavobacteriaceae bacterium]